MNTKNRSSMWSLPLGALSLVLLFGLGGCRRSQTGGATMPTGNGTGQGNRNSNSQALFSAQRLSRADILLDIARLPHAEVGARLGPHRSESQTRWTITPVPRLGAGPKEPDVTPGFREGQPAQPYQGAAAWESTPATLSETRFIQLDPTGSLQLETMNDHGYGVSALLIRENLYVRMRYGPYLRHHAEGDEVERLRALGYEPGASLLEAVAPFISLGTPSETTRLGRPAWQVSLLRQAQAQTVSRPARQPESAGKSWREAVAVDLLDGYAVVDRQRGALLELRLSVRFIAPRGKTPMGTPSAEGEFVKVEAQHELKMVALGAEVQNVAPPAEWSETPTRPRPTLEKQELLNGLLPARP